LSVAAIYAIRISICNLLSASQTRCMASPHRWNPFSAACERTILDLLEIDADAGASRTAGTNALVSALVKLQAAEAPRTASAPRAPEPPQAPAVPARSVATRTSGALLVLGARRTEPAEAGSRAMGGPSARVASLVGRRQRPRRWPTAGLAALIAPVSAAGVGVHLAGAVALLSGCAVV